MKLEQVIKQIETELAAATKRHGGGTAFMAGMVGGLLGMLPQTEENKNSLEAATLVLTKV